MATKANAHFVDCDINPDTLSWTCAGYAESAEYEYPILRELQPELIPDEPTDPGDTPLSGATPIATKAGLQGMNGNNHYYLINDIDASGAWTPIANFSGVLDGNGYTVSNLTINAPGLDNKGLFANLNTGAEVRNLVISGANITADTYVGALAGRVGNPFPYSGVTDVVIRNVLVTNSTIIGSWEVGGLIGGVGTSGGNNFIDCVVANSTVTAYNEDVGGMVGWWFASSITVDDNFVRCDVDTVTITGDSYVGGFFGWCNAKVVDDNNEARSHAHTCNVDATIVCGNVSDASYFGGFTGAGEGNRYTTCHVNMTITIENASDDIGQVGGFQGNISCYDTNINSYAKGTINIDAHSAGTAYVTRIGGLYGHADIWYGYHLRAWCDVDINIVVSSGASQIDSVGGWCGWAQGANPGDKIPDETFYGNPARGLVSRCFAWGDITISKMQPLIGGVGGFFGELVEPMTIIQNCYSWSKITNTAGSWPVTTTHGVGGFLGYIGTGKMSAEDLTITNVYHADGRLPAPGQVGGLTGKNNGIKSVVYSSCYWDKESSGPPDLILDAGVGGNPKTTKLSKTQSTYVDWDFDVIWYMPPSTPGRPAQSRALWYPTDWSHINGEEVQVLGDGAYLGTDTVSGGQVTLDNNTTTNHVGLYFRSKLQPMKIEGEVHMKNIKHLILQLYTTLGGQYGESLTRLYNIIFRDRDDAFGDSPALFDGFKELAFDGSYNRQGDLWIVQDQPLPMTVLGVICGLLAEDGSS